MKKNLVIENKAMLRIPSRMLAIKKIGKIFEITRIIYLNSSERSEQFLVTECFFNMFPEVSHI